MPNPIEVNALSKRYGDLTAVHDFSLTVKNGEVLGLVGPNGAGKTTTLRALAGIHPPSDGQILICDHDIVEASVEAKRHLAFFPDEPRLFDYLTVEEHLEFTAGIYRVPDYRAKFTPLLEELELEGKRKALPSELSRGMKKKLLVGSASPPAPAALFFDEPRTGLDPLGIRRMKESIVRRKKDGAAVI